MQGCLVNHGSIVSNQISQSVLSLRNCGSGALEVLLVASKDFFVASFWAVHVLLRADDLKMLQK